DYKFSSRTRFNFRAFSLIASREALGVLDVINRADPMEERDFIRSNFKNAGAEARIVHRYDLFGNSSNFLFGARFYSGQTTAQQGFADDGSDANFEFLETENSFASDYLFPSYNVSLFAENIFAITKDFSITPGVRFEYINTQSEGYYVMRNTDLAGNEILRQEVQDDRNRKRSFLLAGVGLSYKPRGLTEIYANFSQNYRAITFNDMRIINPNFRIDPNLKDETGFSADLGIRGTIGNWLSYDVSGFLLSYNNKIGAVLRVDSALYNVYRYRTNISDARNFGLESFVEIDFFKIGNKSTLHGLSWFSNLTVQNGKYINSDESAFQGKQVELVPPIIFRTGLSYSFKSFKATYQFSYTKEHFTEATNAVRTATAVNGIIPSYYVMDLALEYKFKKWFTLSAGVNNLTNNMYYTRRAEGYPGPGIIPAEGISVYGT
ncbi:MAG: TonB-dependent receptor, partial [Chitinophagales bacterium]